MRYRKPVHQIRKLHHIFLSFCVAFLFVSFFFVPNLYVVSEPVVKQEKATLLKVKGAIGPAISDYLQRGFSTSEELQAKVIVLQIDTPGGLDHSMRQIIKSILASPIPVITFVAPDGARAASAGTYILYASHIAAMSPATNLGAATPVSIGGIAKQGDKEDGEQDGEESGKQKISTLEKKIINDASAYIKALAERHDRNAEWAVQAVNEAVSITSTEALELGVIDIVANDIEDLLNQANGRLVKMESGNITLSTDDLSITVIEQSWRTQLLAVISDPNIAYILMLLGIYGLIYELANPGFLVPGVVGGISLLLAFYAFQVLPVNYSGLALILLGIMLLVAEAFAPSFGVLGIGGIISFSIGSLILIKDRELSISLPLIIGMALVTGSLLLFLVFRIISLRKKKTETGIEALLGMEAEVEDDFVEEGRIVVLGESWTAISRSEVRKGEKVKITGSDGLCLIVEKDQEVV